MQKTILSILFCVLIAVSTSAQTTTFTYQGFLKDGATPASGIYNISISLWDAETGGAFIDSNTYPSVPVLNGVFTVDLDFGESAFSAGAARWIEVAVKLSGVVSYTVLTPRVRVKSVPWSIQSLNSSKLGGVAADQYLTITGGNASYIQNQEASPQPATSFWISGRGSAGILNAGAEFQISGNRVLSNLGTFNLFAGINAGQSNSDGFANAFFGVSAGQTNTIGSQNAFFGVSAGLQNTTGDNNAFFGQLAGFVNTTGSSNAFFGAFAGQTNTTGTNNTIIGSGANLGVNNLTFATAVGSEAVVSASNAVVLGRITDNVGIGTTTPTARLHVVGNSIITGNVGIGTTAPQQTLHVNGLEILSTGSDAGFKFRNRGSTSSNDDWVWYANGNIARLFKATGPGDVLTIQPTGEFAVNVLGAAGTVGLCRNASNQIANCSSSLRYKTNIGQFSSGLTFVNQLRPISFDWKDGGMKDVGFGAEDIAKIDPRFVTYNDKGEVEGVKYDRLSVAFVNAFKEQQEQIETLQKTNTQLRTQVNEQREQFDQLKMVVCSIKPDAEICKTLEK